MCVLSMCSVKSGLLGSDCSCLFFATGARHGQFRGCVVVSRAISRNERPLAAIAFRSRACIVNGDVMTLGVVVKMMNKKATKQMACGFPLPKTKGTKIKKSVRSGSATLLQVLLKLALALAWA